MHSCSHPSGSIAQGGEIPSDHWTKKKKNGSHTLQFAKGACKLLSPKTPNADSLWKITQDLKGVQYRRKTTFVHVLNKARDSGSQVVALWSEMFSSVGCFWTVRKVILGRSSESSLENKQRKTSASFWEEFTHEGYVVGRFCLDFIKAFDQEFSADGDLLIRSVVSFIYLFFIYWRGITEKGAQESMFLKLIWG